MSIYLFIKPHSRLKYSQSKQVKFDNQPCLFPNFDILMELEEGKIPGKFEGQGGVVFGVVFLKKSS